MKRLLIPLLLLTVIFAGCSANNMSTNSVAPEIPMPTTVVDINVVDEVAMDSGLRPEAVPQAVPDNVEIPSPVDFNRKLIMSASVNIETQTFDDSILKVEALCNEFDGYIESSNVYGSEIREYDEYGNYFGNSRWANYRLRIPIDRYNEFLKSAGSIGVVTGKSQNAQDVTDSYFDTESRLKAVELRRDRLFELLETATDTESIVVLETSLSEAIYEVETLTSSLRRLDNQIEYSTIDMNLNEVAKFTDPTPPEPVTFGQRIASAFNAAIKGVADGTQNFIVWVVNSVFGIIIFAVIVVAAVIIIRRIYRKQKNIKIENNEKDNEQ